MAARIGKGFKVKDGKIVQAPAYDASKKRRIAKSKRKRVVSRARAKPQ